MIKKVFVILILFTISFFLFSCELSNNEEETIEAQGLGEAVIYLGETLDLMENVTFTSSTRGDITSTVSILETIDFNQLGVSIITYQTSYENEEIFTLTRRIVVLNAPDSINLIQNGDFTNTPNYSTFGHADYPSHLQYIIDPDLRRLQVIIQSVSDNMEWPHISFPSISLDEDSTYTLSMLVSGTAITSFSVDIVETTDPSISVYEILDSVINPVTVNVSLDENGMQLFTYQFTPLKTTSNAKLRLMFGSSDSSERIIYIDNIRIDS